MKRRILLLALCLLSLTAFAQDRSALRDSLSAAVDRLGYYPDSTDLRLRKASWNIELGQWQYAKDEYDYVLKREPRNIAALFYRAFVNEKMKRYGFARLDYETLLSVVPGNFEGRLGLALLNQKDHHYTEALDNINILVSQYPDSAVAYAARGGMEAERNMLDLAEYDFGKAIELAPDNTEYRLNRVDVRLRMKRKDEARDDLDDMVKRCVSRVTLADWDAKCR